MYVLVYECVIVGNNEDTVCVYNGKGLRAKFHKS